MARRQRLVRCALGVVLLGILLSLAWSGTAEAQPARSTQTTFQWHDPKMRDAFKACMEVVDWIARGTNGDPPHRMILRRYIDDGPAGIDRDLWMRAVNASWYRFGFRHQEFTYRPRCELLLPNDYVTRVPIRYWSGVFSECLAVVGGDTAKDEHGEPVHPRPSVVPAWYWEVSLDIGHCYPLLPLGAFGLGPDQNDWSQWTPDDEQDYPESHSDPAVMADYHSCRDGYIKWRMEHGHAGAGGLGSVYDYPPNAGASPRVWHEALHFYRSGTRGAETRPAEWKPNCKLILLVNECQPTGGSNRALLPEQCLGPHPISAYDIGYSAYDEPNDIHQQPGGTLTQSIPRHLWGGMTNFAFSIGTWGIRIANWAVDWAYRFDIAQYDVLAIKIGDAYQESLLGNSRLRLAHLFWVLLVGWAGFMSLRGRSGVAGTEILATIILLLISGTLVGHRERYMDATWLLMDKTSTALLVAGMGQDPSDDSLPNRDRLVDDLQRQIQFTFVEEPYDHLSWGQSLGDPNAPACSSTGPPARPEGCNRLRNCAAARYHILSSDGPHGANRWPRQHMFSAGSECQAMAVYNRNPNSTRTMGAVLVMVAAVVVAVLLVVVGLTIVVAKLVAVMLFALLPFAVMFVILPGQGRKLWWSWATTLMQVVVAAIGMSFLLSLLLLTLKELSSLTAEVDLIERFALMDILVLMVWAARRSLLHSGQAFASRLSEYLSATRGSGVTWQQAAAGARPGMDLTNVDRVVGGAVARPAIVAQSSILLRMHERRQARRGYKNLTNLAKWKRSSNYRKSLRDQRRRRRDPQGTPRSENFPLP